MNSCQLIFTEATECQDCYKCVRRCPVKAIRVRDGHASVDPERCVYCGACVSVCPNNAKHVRNDLSYARRVMATTRSAFVSLAPSFASEFSEYTVSQVYQAIEALGFQGVSETAIGAEMVTREVEKWFGSPDTPFLISTACPVVVDLVTKYYPDLVPYLSNSPSPAIAHASYLRRHLGEAITVIFVGPCIAKKGEADDPASPIDVSLTFADLRSWFGKNDIDPATFQPDVPVFDALGTAPGTTGRIYPIDGGMSAMLAVPPEVRLTRCVAADGTSAVGDLLESVDPESASVPIFLELLACDGGCINGPGMSTTGSFVGKRTGLVNFATHQPSPVGSAVEYPLPKRWSPAPFSSQPGPTDEITRALESVGKRTREDQLNCGGCGYDTCACFAQALVDGRAEVAMCVTYMRRLAQKKKSALLKTMPSAVVTVDADLRIVDSNRNFARLCGADELLVYDTHTGLEGAMLSRFLPDVSLFEAVLQNGKEILDRTIRLHDSIVRLSVFPIEKYHLVGAILLDITDPAMQKQHIVDKSRKVIEKNLETVQQIAYLLGENASETELILNSIVQSFSGDVTKVTQR